ncbi:hypothetical protein J2741_001462 [Methanolinea mesophila]|uniref:hypothetical protein n=1 Tax=Methanolinea mesophila TaxID=547055 RepID=UPI001AE7C1A2|nr:hypothetical protein [Methanolinea mesophila]MBP1928915.1 hypothetical protein [Methanolinea mesophila]
MCCSPTGKFASNERSECGCSCSCPATMTIEDEIRLLEDHKGYFLERIAEIDRKIAALKSAKQ